MLFFGFHMLFARVPERKNIANFLLSRRLMGTALLVLSANYSVHLVVALRYIDVDATILMNVATYFLTYWLFTSAMMTLLDRNYVTSARFSRHLCLWLVYSAAAVAVHMLPLPARHYAMGVMAFCLVVYGLLLTSRILMTYRRAIKLFENTHSDDIGAYIRWLSVFTHWAVCYGVGCGLLTFLPDRFVFIWILASIPFYIYLYCSYQNYIFFCEDVEEAIEEDGGLGGMELPDDNRGADPAASGFHCDLSARIDAWINSEGYRTPGITLNQLSALLGTNRTYLSEYINNVYKMTFRDWVTGLRIEYAKRLMSQNPMMKIQDLSESSGFLSVSHFSRIFKEKEGCTPSNYKLTFRQAD